MNKKNKEIKTLDWLFGECCDIDVEELNSFLQESLQCLQRSRLNEEGMYQTQIRNKVQDIIANPYRYSLEHKRLSILCTFALEDQLVRKFYKIVKGKEFEELRPKLKGYFSELCILKITTPQLLAKANLDYKEWKMSQRVVCK